MIIHVVQPGETLTSISDLYKISVERLILENGLTNPDNLVVGQTIIIIYPEITYTVSEGDSLISIADKFGVSLMELLRNNPHLTERKYIYPGETIVIRYSTDKLRRIVTSGYAYPYIDRDTLKKSLPYLTYLTVFNYRFTAEGEIIEIDDAEIVKIAKSYGVAPMMLISTLSEQGTGSSEVAYSILNSAEVQERLLSNVIRILRAKGYYGLNIYIQYINPENRLLEEAFIKRFATRLHGEGFRILLTLTPKTNIERTQITYEQIDFTTLAKTVDGMLFLSYDWAYSYGPPASVTPVNILRQVLDFIITLVPSEKIFLGLPIIGYDWQLPYIPGYTKANAITYDGAIQLAFESGVAIQFNELTGAPYYFYLSDEQGLHIVWFKDARSINIITDIVKEYSLQGLSIWNIMNFYTQMWLIINAEFDIEKIINIDSD